MEITPIAVKTVADSLYLGLVRRLPLRTDADLDAAIAIIGELTGREDLAWPPSEEEDDLEVLSRLVEACESETEPSRR